MGAEPYWYFVKYQPDTDKALQELRQREFRAGRYDPAMHTLFHLFPTGPHSPAPGAQHNSIEEAITDAEADGTRSILDIERVGQEPDFGVAAPLADGILEKIYGTVHPTREMIEGNMDFLEDVERGQCVYAVVHKGDKPDEIFFAGYSCD